MFKDPKEMADFMKSFTPQFKTNKNGYEIRTKILEMAKDQMAMEYSFKFQGWEQSQKKGPKRAQKIKKITPFWRPFWDIFRIFLQRKF